MTSPEQQIELLVRISHIFNRNETARSQLFTMSAASPEPSAISPTARIAELEEIDKSIAQLLRSAGEALNVLGSSTSSDQNAPDLTSAKSQFLDSTTAYFQNLSSIDVRLRRQVYALEEAGFVKPGDVRDARRGAAASSVMSAGGGGSVGGSRGTGGISDAGDTSKREALDVRWLEGGGQRVEKDMRRELWKRAREFVKNLEDSPATADGSAKMLDEQERRDQPPEVEMADEERGAT